MATRVAINGFGRIGRLVARAILEKQDSGLELVAINDLADAESNALLFKRDSVHGAYKGEVRAEGNDLIIDGRRVLVTAEKDPAKLPHGTHGVDIALEFTGFFTDRDKAGAHLTAGASRLPPSAIRASSRTATTAWTSRSNAPASSPIATKRALT